MANISKIKVGNTSYGITPASHASTATTYGAATASKYGHVKLSDNYTSSAGAAASGIGASSAAVYNAYNTLNSNLEAITPDAIYAGYGHTYTFTSSYDSYWNSTNNYFEFPISIKSGYDLYKYGAVLVNVSACYNNNATPSGHYTFIAYSNGIVYPSIKTWENSTLLAAYESANAGQKTPTSISVILNSTSNPEIIVRVSLSSQWSSTTFRNISVGVLFL